MQRIDEDFKHESDEAIRTNSQEFETYVSENYQWEGGSLFDSLMNQAREIFCTDVELEMAEFVIGNIDHFGFFNASLEEIAVAKSYSLIDFERVLQTIQTFEPYGMATKDLKESLLIQLKCMNKESTLSYTLIQRHFEDLLQQKMHLICKSLKITQEQFKSALHEIAALRFYGTVDKRQPAVSFLIHDVSLIQDSDGWRVETNEEFTPGFRLNGRYLSLLEDHETSIETKEFIHKNLNSLKWLLRNIHQRKETLEKVTNEIVKRQKAFFFEYNGQLQPLTMKELADELGIHESTIMRAISNKYLSCSKGILSFKLFFSHGYITNNGEGVAANSVQQTILNLIRQEDKKKPLSDQALASLLQEQGIFCARRTVAKYRSGLNLGNAKARKKVVA